jgi:transcriptional regulator with XRE-family HTH domain
MQGIERARQAHVDLGGEPLDTENPAATLRQRTMSEPIKPPTFGQYLRGIRQDQGIALRYAASNLGISPAYLCDIEHDRRVPSEAVLIPLAQLFDLSYADLYMRSGRLPEPLLTYLRANPQIQVLVNAIRRHNLDETAMKRLTAVVLAELTGQPRLMK